VEELHKYLRENKYLAHQKNTIAAIAMYNRKELPKPDPESESGYRPRVLNKPRRDKLKRD
jgi:hypothetical protein